VTIYFTLIGICAVWFFMALYMDQRNTGSSYTYEGSMSGAAAIAGIFTFIFALSTLISSYNQVMDIESLDIVDQKIEVYNDKATQITEKLSLILMDTYADHEKSIFKNMTPDDVSFLFIKYPELNASQTFIELSTHIRELNDALYAEQLKKLDLIRDVRFRKQNPVAITWFIKEYKE